MIRLRGTAAKLVCLWLLWPWQTFAADPLPCGADQTLQPALPRFTPMLGASLSAPLVLSLRLTANFRAGLNESYCQSIHRGMLEFGPEDLYLGPDIEIGVRGYRAGLNAFYGFIPMNLGLRVLYTDLWANRSARERDGAWGAEAQLEILFVTLTVGGSHWQSGGNMFTIGAGFLLPFEAYPHLKPVKAVRRAFTGEPH